MLLAMTISQRKASEVKTDISESLPEQKSRMWLFQIWRMITNLVHAR